MAKISSSQKIDMVLVVIRAVTIVTLKFNIKNDLMDTPNH
jgi:hypothetical protein